MRSVYDEILRFEYENLEMPETLDQLVPEHLRRDQLVASGKPLYIYDRKNRRISMASGQRVRGVITRTLPPAFLDLPVSQELTRKNVAAVEHESTAKEEDPPKGAFVFEAEHYTDHNYGWEIHPDKSCGGGAYAYSKEGMGNGPGQTRCRVFNFYNIHEKEEYTYIRWHFHRVETGQYNIYGRIWTTGSHCSNTIIVGIDGAGPDPASRKYKGLPLTNVTPFRWVWTKADGGPVTIEKGDHVPETGDYLLKIQSDDQLVLWIDGKEIYSHNYCAPVTRSAKRLRHKLTKGKHKIRLRVNQWHHTSYGDGRWQACFRIRTPDDDLSIVYGL